MQTFLAAAIQMNSTDDRERNLADAMALIDKAVARGAQFVALPENVDMIGPQGVMLVDSGRDEMSGRLLAAIRALTPRPIHFILNTSADPDHVGVPRRRGRQRRRPGLGSGFRAGLRERRRQ